MSRHASSTFLPRTTTNTCSRYCNKLRSRGYLRSSIWEMTTIDCVASEFRANVEIPLGEGGNVKVLEWLSVSSLATDCALERKGPDLKVYSLRWKWYIRSQSNCPSSSTSVPSAWDRAVTTLSSSMLSTCLRT